MKVLVKDFITDNPNHHSIHPATYDAVEDEWEEGRQRRLVKGYSLRARLPGYGWITVNVPKEYWQTYVADGRIKPVYDAELSEADAEGEIMLHLQRTGRRG